MDLEAIYGNIEHRDIEDTLDVNTKCINIDSFFIDFFKVFTNFGIALPDGK